MPLPPMLPSSSVLPELPWPEPIRPTYRPIQTGLSSQPQWLQRAGQAVPSNQAPPQQQQQTSPLKWIPSPYSWQSLISSHHDPLNLSKSQPLPSFHDILNPPTAIPKPTRHSNSELWKAIIAPPNLPASTPTTSYAAPQPISQPPSHPPPQPAQIAQPPPITDPTIFPVQQQPRPQARTPSSSSMKPISAYFTPSPKLSPTAPRQVTLPTSNLLQ